MSAEAEPTSTPPPSPMPDPNFEDILGSGDASTPHPNDPPPSPPRPKYEWITRLRNFLKPRRLELAMWVLRFITCFFTFLAVLPFFGDSVLYVRRALIANAATSALRLHQRIEVPFSLTKDYFIRIAIEDACHYIFFSLIFLLLGHISFSIIPIALFSSVHFANFTLKMLEAVKGPSAITCGLGSLLFVWTHKTSWILRMAAISEIGLMGLVVFGVFQGAVSILMPFVYYRFLTFRYASRRNQFTRIVFRDLRITVEKFAASGNCPLFLQRLIMGSVQILCKLAPPMPPQN